jgi:RNA polymerase sigma factor (sigma-70 family)
MTVSRINQSTTGSSSTDLVRAYQLEVGRHQLLSKDDEVRLARLIEDGKAARHELDAMGDAVTRARRRELEASVERAEEARRSFIQANLRLVLSMAKRYQAPGLSLLDIVQEGNIGLMQALERFDWRKGFKFSTYATWWIRRANVRAVKNTGRTIRLPIHAGEMLAQVRQTEARLEAERGRPVSRAEVASEAGLGEDKLATILRFSAEPLSLDEPVGGDGDHNLGEVVQDLDAPSPEGEAISASLHDELEHVLKTLGPREREILRLHYGLGSEGGKTLAQVAAGVGLSSTRVRQLHGAALRDLRTRLESFAG